MLSLQDRLIPSGSHRHLMFVLEGKVPSHIDLGQIVVVSVLNHLGARETVHGAYHIRAIQGGK